MKKSKGNIMVTFIMLIGLSFTVFSAATLTRANLKISEQKTGDIQAFYLAEAGLNKAIWYLATPISSGGRGGLWRGSFSELLGRGSYSVQASSVIGTTNTVLIISTGEVSDSSATILQKVVIDFDLPNAFEYSIFSNDTIDITGNAELSGNVFVNGNTDMGGNAIARDGAVFHPEGYSVAGDATDGGIPEPVPEMPTFDSTFYDNKLAEASAYTPGNQTLTNIDLDGGTLYVNGDLTITNGIIVGAGTIIVTGDIEISGNTVSDGSEITVISGDDTVISGNSSLANSTFYSTSSTNITGNGNLDMGMIISSGDILFDGNMSFDGVVFSEGPISLLGNMSIDGALVADNFIPIEGGATVTFDESAIPPASPPGFTSDSNDVDPIKGTWQQL